MLVKQWIEKPVILKIWRHHGGARRLNTSTYVKDDIVSNLATLTARLLLCFRGLLLLSLGDLFRSGREGRIIGALSKWLALGGAASSWTSHVGGGGRSVFGIEMKHHLDL